MSGVALALHQFRFDQKIFWRNPASVFFTVLLPLIFLFIFATIFGNDAIETLAASRPPTYYVPAIITLAVVSATAAEPRDLADRRPRERASSSGPRARRCRPGCSSPDGSATRSSSR